MKKMILSFALGISALTTFAQTTNRVELVKTFKVNKACEIVAPTQNVSIIKDNSLSPGVVRVVLVIEHNAQEAAYNSLLSRRVWHVEADNKIGFDADPSPVQGRNGFTLEENYTAVVYMSAATAKMK